MAQRRRLRHASSEARPFATLVASDTPAATPLSLYFYMLLRASVRASAMMEAHARRGSAA